MINLFAVFKKNSSGVVGLKHFTVTDSIFPKEPLENLSENEILLRKEIDVSFLEYHKFPEDRFDVTAYDFEGLVLLAKFVSIALAELFERAQEELK